jgi:TfoX/Sxy family transcriptional regulator of competence genes
MTLIRSLMASFSMFVRSTVLAIILDCIYFSGLCLLASAI